MPWIHLGSVRHERDHRTSEATSSSSLTFQFLQTEAQRCQMMETVGHLASKSGLHKYYLEMQLNCAREEGHKLALPHPAPHSRGSQDARRPRPLPAAAVSQPVRDPGALRARFSLPAPTLARVPPGRPSPPPPRSV